MKTRTIYSAMTGAYRRAILSNADFRIRQWHTFEAELLRRLDERDTLQRELAEARAFISSIIDEPKDYPAEVSA